MRKAFLQLHFAVFLAGFTGIMGRLIGLNEALLVWYRILLACLFLWAVVLIRPQPTVSSPRQKKLAALIGSILSLHWVIFYLGIRLANVSTALVCFSSVGFFTALLEPLLFRHKPDWAEVALGLLAIAGIAIIFRFDPRYQTGIIVSLISAFLAAVFAVLNSRLLKGMDPRDGSRFQLSGGLLFLTALLPFYLHFYPAAYYLPTITDWIWLIILSLVCTVLAYTLYMRVLQKLPAFTVNLTYSLEPIYSIALAFILFREDKSIRGSFYAGLLVIVLAVLLQTWRLKRERRGRE